MLFHSWSWIFFTKFAWSIIIFCRLAGTQAESICTVVFLDMIQDPNHFVKIFCQKNWIHLYVLPVVLKQELCSWKRFLHFAMCSRHSSKSGWHWDQLIRINCLENHYSFPWALSCVFWKIASTIAQKYGPVDFIWFLSLNTQSGFAYEHCMPCSVLFIFLFQRKSTYLNDTCICSMIQHTIMWNLLKDVKNILKSIFDAAKNPLLATQISTIFWIW